MSKQLLINYYEYFGRMGELDGLFITDEEGLALMKKHGKVYLGECLGKHSSITGTLSDQTLKLKSDDQDFIAKLQEVLNVGEHVSGTDIVGTFFEALAEGQYEDSPTN